ncbi:MAG: formylmethanofuran dehydrogenase subunit A [Candidatus Bathyarchaeota archaeon]|nr:MAG: formylmethanofuran dehydrogenase subunit A [Candidatus Bathyarchaeota archaeon]
MKDLLIKNGLVYDPSNGIEGEEMDIAISKGKIVSKIKNGKVIDAAGMIVMPGGVDIHSHIVGAKVNTGRLLRPEDHYKDVEPKTLKTRSGVGYSIPSTFTTGYRYARMGWTTVMDPAMPPLKAKHTHEEMNDTPMLDKGSYPLLGSNWFVLEHLRAKDYAGCAAYVAWMMNATKGYAIKIVNPGGLEAWGFGRNVRDIDDPVPNFDITPREIVQGLCKVNELLNMPHTIHVHTNNLGKPGNYVTTLETMKCVENMAHDKKPIIHLTHCQFSAFAGHDWRSFRSASEEIAKYVNSHSHVTIDLGQIVFTNTTTMTADGPFQFILYQITGNKWVNNDVETETSSGIVPFQYKRKSFVHATQWTIGLELALQIEDPWKVFLTTDHPNAGPFTAYPQIIMWLMSRRSRNTVLDKISKRAKRKTLLSTIDREYTLNEIAIVTRAGQAKALGFNDKGHLGIGAEADIAIYELNPEKANLENHPEKIKRAFQNAAYTIKNGEIVVKEGKVVKSTSGKTFWADIRAPPSLLEIEPEIQRVFEEYYTVKYENYLVPEHYLASSNPIPIQAKV